MATFRIEFGPECDVVLGQPRHPLAGMTDLEIAAVAAQDTRGLIESTSHQSIADAMAARIVEHLAEQRMSDTDRQDFHAQNAEVIAEQDAATLAANAALFNEFFGF